MIRHLLVLLVSLSTAAAGDLSEHPFWKHYVGEWHAKGELKGQDGNVVTVIEHWTGKGDGEAGFLIEGDRTTNTDKQSFKWRISLNPATQVCEAVLVGQDQNQQIRFEANISEVAMTLEMKAVTGGGGSAITVSEAFTDDSRTAFNSKVTFTNEQGDVTLEGTILHSKEVKKE
jgi:hypothetical protein